MVDNLDDGRERDFHNLAVRPLDLNAGRGQCLSGLHAADDAAHTITVARHNFDVAFAIERLERRQGPGNFHSACLGSDSIFEPTDYTWSD